MAEIKAFNAMRFAAAEKLGDLACPPYDIVSERERLAYLAKNSRNIIRLELPREGENPYETAGETLREWLEDGTLSFGGDDALYIYEEEFLAPGGEPGETKKLKGIMARVRLEPFEKGIILPHEETLSKAKDDRFKLMCATGCNFSSVYSLYFDKKREAENMLDLLSSGKPDMEFKGLDGIIHRVWIVSGKDDIDVLSRIFADKKLYIADGHHRYETALRYRSHLAENGTDTGGNHPANYILMTLVSVGHEGLVVLPTHRIVAGLVDFSAEKVLNGCGDFFETEDIPAGEAQARLEAAAAAGKKAIAFYYGKTALLTLKDTAALDGVLPEMSRAYRTLDVTVLHALILERLLGLDKKSLADQKNLSYTMDIGEAFAAVDGGKADCAFIINPTGVEEIASVAGAGEKMPQKSTYFYPKLITGHIMNRIL